MKLKALFLLSFAGFGAALAGAQGALAASPAYCALYSREYAIDTVQPTAASAMFQSIQDQAYYRCLNLDEDPALPQRSAYFGADPTKASTNAARAATSAAIVTPTLSPAKPAVEPVKPPVADTASIGDIPAFTPPLPTPKPSAPAATATPPPAPKAVVTASASSVGQKSYRGTQLQAWTPEWASWCAANFPNSWDAKTGTILHYGSGSRELCK